MNAAAVETLTGKASLYSGIMVGKLEEAPRIAVRVSETLGLFPHKMLQFTPGQLAASMEAGRAAVILGGGRSGERRLEAFAQYWPYEHERGEVYGEGYESLVDAQAVEVGSWLGPGVLLGEEAKAGREDHAKIVFQAAVDLAAQTYPGLSIFAIAEKDNQRAKHVLSSIGGIEIGDKVSTRLSNGTPKEVNFFGMKNISRI